MICWRNNKQGKSGASPRDELKVGCLIIYGEWNGNTAPSAAA